MKTLRSLFPECTHAYPMEPSKHSRGDLRRIAITERQVEECREDALITMDQARGGKDLMGYKTDPDVHFRGNLAEQVFANICGVERMRAPDVAWCDECRREHGREDFPGKLDVKARWEDQPIELMVNRRDMKCMRRFAMAQVMRACRDGWLWCVVPRWRLERAPDVRRGEHRHNPRAANHTLDAWAVDRERGRVLGGECMICGPPWEEDFTNANKGLADMRRVLGKEER